MSQSLDTLLQHSGLWRASDGVQQSQATLATGFAELDAVLAGGGWPADGLTELLHEQNGSGELRLLMPALSELSRSQARWIAWIAPPRLPCATALALHGVATERMLVVHCRDHRDQLWATEQALRSGTCSAVLSWPSPHHLKHTDLRRLQLAAREGESWGVVFRSMRTTASQSSPAELRLLLETGPEPDPARLQVQILKRRGGWPLEHLQIRCDDVVSRRILGNGRMPHMGPRELPRREASFQGHQHELQLQH